MTLIENERSFLNEVRFHLGIIGENFRKHNVVFTNGGYGTEEAKSNFRFTILVFEEKGIW